MALYTVDVLPNLAQTTVTIFHNDEDTLASAKFSIGPKVLRCLLKGASSPLDIALPVASDVKTIQLHKNVDSIDVKLRFANTSVISTAYDNPWLAKYQEFNPTIQDMDNLFCKFCAQQFKFFSDHEAAIKRVASLPSDNWHELTDLWVCACTSDMMRNTLATLSDGEIRARPNVILVGLNHLLVHKSNIDTRALFENVALTRNEANRNWVPVQCRRCMSELGRLESESTNSKSTDPLQPNTNIKLFKHRIATSIDRGQDKFSRHRLETFISSIMVQASQAHSAFRFVIRDENRAPIAYVVLSNWTSLYRCSLDEMMPGEVFPVLKVQYLSGVGSEAIPKEVSSWQETSVVELITLPRTDCFEILSTMEQRSCYIPHARRSVSAPFANTFLYFVPFDV